MRTPVSEGRAAEDLRARSQVRAGIVMLRVGFATHSTWSGMISLRVIIIILLQVLALRVIFSENRYPLFGITR
jgi:hypothetical protein